MPIEPFAESYRYLSEASDAVTQAEEVADYQAIGVRCRKALLAFADAAQTVLLWTSTEPAPKRADLKSWADHICSVALAGTSHEHRRLLFKTLLDNAWKFANWLTHAKGTNWHDAEAAFEVTKDAIGLCSSAVIQHLRGVPDECPACGSHRLSPQRGFRTSLPNVEWERPTWDKCGRTGEPVPIDDVPEPPDDDDRKPPQGECIIATVPLRALRSHQMRRSELRKVRHVMLFAWNKKESWAPLIAAVVGQRVVIAGWRRFSPACTKACWVTTHAVHIT